MNTLLCYSRIGDDGESGTVPTAARRVARESPHKVHRMVRDFKSTNMEGTLFNANATGANRADQIGLN